MLSILIRNDLPCRREVGSVRGEMNVYRATFPVRKGESRNTYFYLPEVTLKGYTRNS